MGMGIGSGPSTSRFQVPRRTEMHNSNLSNYGVRMFRHNIRPSEDDDSSDNESGSSTIPSSSLAGLTGLRNRNRLHVSRTDDLAAASGMTASSSVPANRWRQSNPIRSPRGVEQRMR